MNTATPTQLQYVDIHKAFNAIQGQHVLPPLDNVSIKDSAKGISSDSLEKSLVINDVVVDGSLIKGIDITASHVSVTVNNSHVNSSKSGHGFEYSREKTTPVNLWDVDTSSSVSYPLYLSVESKPNQKEDRIKVMSLEYYFQDSNKYF